MARLMGLADANNFFVSCERVFRPDLARRPVVVLSNNDGCIIARSNEAKAMGIPMGAPMFQYEAFCKKHGVVVFSGNMALYRDMSSRVLKTLRRFSDLVEPYSIDESFFNLAIAEIDDPEGYCREIRRAILRSVGIPVSIGISTTKTLCKLASEVAKERGKKDPDAPGVFYLPALAAANLFRELPVSEIWGIGGRMAHALGRCGITTVEDLLRRDEDWVRKNMSIRGVRTVRELRGISCFPLVEEEPPQKSLMVSSSFGQRLKDFEPIKEAVVKHAAEGAFRLRHEGLRAGCVGCHLRTSYFIQDVVVRDFTVPLAPPTSITQEIVSAAVAALEHVYRPNIEYAKSGVYFGDLEPAEGGQMLLEDLDPRRQKMNALMKAMDEINERFGDKAIIPASIVDTSESDPHKGRLSGWKAGDLIHIQLRGGTTELDDRASVRAGAAKRAPEEP